MKATKALLSLLVMVALTLVQALPAQAGTKAGEIKIDQTGRNFVVRLLSTGDLKKATFVNGQFSFVDIPNPGPNFLYQGAVDINNSGLADLVSLNISQGDRGDALIWNEFSSALAVTPRSVRTLWRVDTVGDLDGDGIGDMVWRFTGITPNFDDQGVSYIWFMNQNGTVNQVRKRGGAPLTWTLLGASDVNSDGAADMVYVSPANAVRVLMATANRTCANLSAGSIDAGYTPLYVADFTFNGTPDILARNATTGAVRLTTINAAGISLPAYTGAPDDANASCTSSASVIPQVFVRDIASDPVWSIYATGDFNNDGLIDIVWKKPDGTLAVWIMAVGGNLPQVIANAGTAPLGYKGLTQAGGASNKVETVTYAIWGRGGSPFLVTKTGVTAVVNKSQYQVGVFPLGNCLLATALANDGKLFVQCQDAVSLIRRNLYVDTSKNELYDFAGVIPLDVILLGVGGSNSNKPEWGKKARVADGWYYTTFDVSWVLNFRADTGVVTTVKAGIFAVDGNVKVLTTYTK